MKKIILDTNFVTIPFQFKVDIYSELGKIVDEKYELIFLNQCKKELEKIKFGKSAIKLMKKNGVKFLDVKLIRNPDETILRYAKEKNAIVATQDKDLKKKALKNGLSVITLRQKKYLKVIK